MSNLDREERFANKYDDLKGKLELWGDYVKSQLLTKFAQTEPNVTCRLKEQSSLYGKAFHRNFYDSLITNDVDETINKILIEITDKVGVRIVVKDPETAKSVFDSIKDDICWKSNVTRIREDTIYSQPDTFSYTGYHVIVSPEHVDKHLYPTEVKPFVTCEVQIRTKLQDAYSAVSHDIVYKKVFRHDMEIRRLLARAMALLEVVDESFKSVYSMTSDMDRTIPAYVDNLVNLYRVYFPSFREDQIDYRVFDQYLKSLRVVPTDRLESFLTNKDRDIKIGLKHNRERFLFKQPIILLLAYYAAIDPDYLEEAGLLSSEDLRRLSEGFNIASDIN